MRATIVERRPGRYEVHDLIAGRVLCYPGTRRIWHGRTVEHAQRVMREARPEAMVRGEEVK